MGADLFGSFAEATCAAMVIASSSKDLVNNWGSMMYPMLISAVGIIAGVLTLIVVPKVYPVRQMEDVEKALKGVLVISTVIMTPIAIVLSAVCLPAQFELNSEFKQVQWWYCAVSICLGLWSGLVIGFVTEYYTSHSYTPVREIAETQKQSAATGIIYGLALGYLSCIVPVCCLALTILISHTLCGMFGVALGALGMLGTMTMGLTIDAYGPISDNAGGIAEMCGMPDEVRTLTDCLDAAGNTTAAIGFGKNCCAGLLSGALVSSVQLAISMSNTGGAWDNSKKYISAGGLGPEFRKGSEAHKNSVTGDTVGDPLKDTSGPALNIVMKLTAIISLVFGSVIASFSNASGGPIWLS